MNFLNILIYLSLISFIFLTVKSIIALGKIDQFFAEFKQKANNIEKDIREIKESSIKTLDSMSDLKPLVEESLHKMNELQTKSIETLSNTDETFISAKQVMDNVNSKIEKIDHIIEPFELLAKNFYSKVAEPITNTGKVVSAIFKAANMFASKMRQ